MTGFEPATSASRTQRSSQAELHPDEWIHFMTRICTDKRIPGSDWFMDPM